MSDTENIFPIQLTKDGVSLVPRDGEEDPDLVMGEKCWIGTHSICGGPLELWPSSDTLNAIICKVCFLRVEVPRSVETYRELKDHLEGGRPNTNY